MGTAGSAAVSSLLNDSDALEGLGLHNSHIQSLHGSLSVCQLKSSEGEAVGKGWRGDVSAGGETPAPSRL